MKAARVSMYGPDLNPVTAVLHEKELRVPLEEALREQRILPGGYVVIERFDTERDIVGATMEAVNLMADEDKALAEKNAAMLYHYCAMQFPMMVDGGSCVGTIPCPLSAETIMDALEQLSHHPNYRHHLCVQIAEDMQIITMRDGEAKVVRDWSPNGDSH